ncbi:MAG TPA: Grx4 family monothiol glutaredoxin [Gammaproteobacteria bacterium]|nr:Grx4 family monothiol glutaredoxin [Gammaproteobacteria bacterium]
MNTSHDVLDDTLSLIKQQIADNPILLYMKGTPDFPQCGFSARAVEMLNACGAQFASVNILDHPDIRQMLPRYANWPTFPQLYVQGELIGGCDIMQDLYTQGDLQKLVGE